MPPNWQRLNGVQFYYFLRFTKHMCSFEADGGGFVAGEGLKMTKTVGLHCFVGKVTLF